MQMAVGTRIGEFTVTEQVAQGGSGRVWRAYGSQGLSDHVAVKVFDRPSEADVEAERLRAVASVAGVGQLVAAGTGWLAIRWVEGRTLAHLIQTEGPLGLDRTIRLMDQLATTLDELHATGLVHGDLCPSNVIVDLHDCLTLIDLGSTSGSSDDIHTTIRVELRTTPRYASPEVASGARAGSASDRYALALIAYEALTGRSPFPAVANPMAMLGHHLSSTPDPISETAPKFGTRFDQLFERALSKMPADRHSDARSFVAELRSQAAVPDRQRWATRWAFGAVAVAASAAVVVAAITALGDGRRISGSENNIAAATQSTAASTPRPTVEPTSTAVVLRSSPEWLAGMGASFSCNLLTLPGFEQERLPDNWYRGDPDNTISLVPGAGVDASTALQVGAGPRYGLVAERIPVTGGETYHFSAWVRRKGEPTRSGMWLEFETVANERIEGVDELEFGPSDDLLDGPGRRVTRFFDVPVEAAWAAPTFFKDGSTGSLLVDEVVFGPASECGDVPT